MKQLKKSAILIILYNAYQAYKAKDYQVKYLTYLPNLQQTWLFDDTFNNLGQLQTFLLSE